MTASSGGGQPVRWSGGAGTRRPACATARRGEPGRRASTAALRSGVACPCGGAGTRRPAHVVVRLGGHVWPRGRIRGSAAVPVRGGGANERGRQAQSPAAWVQLRPTADGSSTCVLAGGSQSSFAWRSSGMGGHRQLGGSGSTDARQLKGGAATGCLRSAACTAGCSNSNCTRERDSRRKKKYPIHPWRRGRAGEFGCLPTNVILNIKR
ncbi:hypothetical protein PVAP13_7NG315924 [Panicum virgatum]|uniref:Uncharacterized protein n=1 Tax=Panicum virgatum TaxID=38727 RepID=A0A8T0Q4X7_PANVG|nr:hypothetical protein PVAP13_7NG315924 [Panicum virgatum]